LFSRTVEKLWKITEELNILYKDNWTALADREIAIFQTELLAAGLVTNVEQVRKQNVVVLVNVVVIVKRFVIFCSSAICFPKTFLSNCICRLVLK
jgi:hypothetical protein